VLLIVVVPVGAAVEFEVGAAATATVTVFEAAANERLPAASTTYSLYVPATSPAVDIVESVFAEEIVT
jgi:hypothetical protein